MPYKRNVFIDSENNFVGQGTSIRLNFPSNAFSCLPHERMRLSLTTFEMRRNWYNINQTNNTFFVYDSSAANLYTAIVLTPKQYFTFAELRAEIEAQLIAAGFTGSTCTYDVNTRKFTINLQGVGVGAFITCFQVKSGNNPDPSVITSEGFYNDVHEILGCLTNTEFVTGGTPINSFGTQGVGNYISPFLAQLNTLEAIYIRTNLQSHSYQTTGFEKGIKDQPGTFVLTNIWARIPLEYVTVGNQDLGTLISFEDTNDLFTLELGQNLLTSLQIYITDDKGRLLPEVVENQAKSGNMNFKLTSKFEVYEPDYKHHEQAVVPKDYLSGKNYLP